jgi:ribose-phosphate pyrophosphokinase
VISVHGFPESLAQAGALADALGGVLSRVETHRFADGETLPRVTAPEPHAVLYRSLHDPNAKLIETLLTADALRRAGARRLTLVTPYVPYLRQDQVFEAGQALSRDVVLPLLADGFDAIVVVDPHLHRTARLEDVAPQTRWIPLSGAEAMGRALAAEDGGAFDLVVGPDRESLQWARALAEALHLPVWTFDKKRLSDRDVSLEAPAGAAAGGARVLLVDDVCSSGGTLAKAAEVLMALGASRIEAAVTHALYDSAAALMLEEAGVRALRSCDGCLHPSNAFPLAAPIAAALRREFAL